jgi:hypothetical protein
MTDAEFENFEKRVRKAIGENARLVITEGRSSGIKSLDVGAGISVEERPNYFAHRAHARADTAQDAVSAAIDIALSEGAVMR